MPPQASAGGGIALGGSRPHLDNDGGQKNLRTICSSLEQRCDDAYGLKRKAQRAEARLQTATFLTRHRRGIGAVVAGIAASRFGHSE
jgi:hypothetical protein